MNTDDPGDFFYYDGNRLLEHHHDSATSGEDYLREYVWGLEYIDEAVAQYDTPAGQSADLYYILIDANYNVVALTEDTGALVQQYSYWSYGSLMAVEDGTGTAIDFETYPEQLATNVGHQGLYHDREVGLIFNRARTYNPELGRFMQRDPNETAQLIYTALLSNGSVAAMFHLPIVSAPTARPTTKMTRRRARIDRPRRSCQEQAKWSIETSTKLAGFEGAHAWLGLRRLPTERCYCPSSRHRCRCRSWPCRSAGEHRRTSDMYRS